MRPVKRALTSLCEAFLSLAAESRRRRAIRELQALGSRELADIGISRGEIEFAVRNGHPRRWHRDRKAQSDRNIATLSHDYVPPAHALLLNVGVAPVASLSQRHLLSTPAAPSASREIAMTEDLDWRKVYDFWFPRGHES